MSKYESSLAAVNFTDVEDREHSVNLQDIRGVHVDWDLVDTLGVRVCLRKAGGHACIYVAESPEELLARIRVAARYITAGPDDDEEVWAS